MKYPTIEQVKSADVIQLCKWTRFLPSPGANDIGEEEFKEAIKREAEVMDRILERQKELGGWTPYVSKLIGWEV